MGMEGSENIINGFHWIGKWVCLSTHRHLPICRLQGRHRLLDREEEERYNKGTEGTECINHICPSRGQGICLSTHHHLQADGKPKGGRTSTHMRVRACRTPFAEIN